MISRRNLLLSGLAVTATPAFAKKHAVHKVSGPPVARVAAVSDTYWGQTIVDPYRWMEAKPATAEWTAWLKGEADYASAALARLPQHARVAAAIERYTADVDSLFVTDISADYLFTIRRKPGQQSFSYYATPAAGGAAKLLLDPDALSQAGVPANVNWTSVSPDSRWLAYGIDSGGSESSALHMRNIETLEDITITTISSHPSAWLPDSSGFFYHRLRADAVPGAGDYYSGSSCWLHRIGSDPKDDVEVFRAGEGPDTAQLSDDQPLIHPLPDNEHVLGIHMVNGDWPQVAYVARLADLKVGATPWRQILSQKDQAMKLAVAGSDVYVLANGAASHGEVWRIAAATGERTTVVPAGPWVMDELAVARDGLFIHEIRGPVGGLKRYGFADGRIDDIALPAQGAVWGMVSNVALDGVIFGMDSLTWPARVFRTGPDMTVSELDIMPKLPFEVAPFDTTRLEITARDGAQVPIEILHRKDVVFNGRNPTLIIAYGAYGTILDPGFQATPLAFLELGGVIVYAHVRGGGEKGEDWHNGGKKATKPNTWRDAIDTAEYMIKTGWTSPKHLAVWGTSAGGIMVGRAITERPDLFRVAIGDVGAFNMLRMELTSNGPGNDYEFGTVKKEDEFKALLAMDSYHHVVDGTAYPAVLFMTGANDPRVDPWIVGKMAARMQAASRSGLPVLLRVDYEAGHHATKKAAAVEKAIDMYGFILSYAG